MQVCDLPLPGAADNVACDEALLDAMEIPGAEEILRFWEPSQHFVVLGYANKAATEVNLEFCVRNKIRVVRRCSGGGTVLQGPGCLNYSLFLRIADSGPTSSISTTNELVMGRHRAALETVIASPVTVSGHTDLAMGDRKFSGNAQRRKKEYLVFHGTFLLNLDLELVERALAFPSKQPDYRRGRSHAEFLVNLGLPAARIKSALQSCWGASEPMRTLPVREIERLATAKYSSPAWTFRW